MRVDTRSGRSCGYLDSGQGLSIHRQGHSSTQFDEHALDVFRLGRILAAQQGVWDLRSVGDADPFARDLKCDVLARVGVAVGMCLRRLSGEE